MGLAPSLLYCCIIEADKLQPLWSIIATWVKPSLYRPLVLHELSSLQIRKIYGTGPHLPKFFSSLPFVSVRLPTTIRRRRRLRKKNSDQLFRSCRFLSISFAPKLPLVGGNEQLVAEQNKIEIKKWQKMQQNKRLFSCATPLDIFGIKFNRQLVWEKKNDLLLTFLLKEFFIVPFWVKRRPTPTPTPTSDGTK